jgi:hypothetical protein
MSLTDKVPQAHSVDKLDLIVEKDTINPSI